jgi:formate dehydrogenase major subunit
MINLTINGKNVEVKENTTVLNAARQAGIEIPTLCDHKELTPYGGCRLCLVEVEGSRTLQPSCTLPVSNGMIVRTDTPKTKAAREFILTLLFSERNHFCPYCQVSGGDCELQNAAYHEGMTHWPIQPNWKPYPMDASHPYIVMENNRCILCRRCVRACNELVGNFTLAFEERGPFSLLVADVGVPLGASSCVSCGTCVQVCPTGTLIDRPSAYKGREAEVERTHTICVGCSLGCGMDMLTRNNHLVRIEGIWEAEVNGGVLCKVGRFLPVEDIRPRLHTPLVRKSGKLKETSWEEALMLAAEKLRTFLGGKNGEIAAGASSKLTAESLYAFQQLFHVALNGKMVRTLDGENTAASSQLATELGKSFEGDLEDLKNADCVVCMGVDPAKQHEVASFFFKRNIPSGTKVIVVDPEENQMNLWADISIKPKKVIDAALIRGLAAITLKIGSNTQKTREDPKKALADAIAHSGLLEKQLHEIASLIAGAEKTVFLFGAALSKETLKELVDYAGILDARILGLKGGANSLAAARLGMDGSFDPGGTKLAVIALADEEPSTVLLRSLQSIPYKVVLASHATQLTDQADIVFPAQHWSEQAGSYINVDGKLQESHAALKASGMERTELEMLQDLAEKLNVKLAGDWKQALQQHTSSMATGK